MKGDMTAWQAWLIAFTLVGLPCVVYLLPIEWGDYNARWAAWAVINIVTLGGLYRWSTRH